MSKSNEFDLIIIFSNLKNVDNLSYLLENSIPVHIFTAPNIYNKKLMAKKLVQTKNPKTGQYVKIDRGKGRIVSSKKTPGPYKNIPVIRKSK